MDAFLAYIGINPADLFAAFTGGICAALLTTGPKPSLWNMVVAIIVGTGVGSYGGPVIPGMFGAKPSGFWTMGIGASGVPIIKGLILGFSRVRFLPSPGRTEGGQS